MGIFMVSGQHWLAKLAAYVHAFITGYGGLGVLLLAVADSSFLSVPEGNDILIVILSAGKSWGNMAYYVGLTITGSVTGCMLLYYVGFRGGNPMLRRKFSSRSIERAEELFRRYGVLTVIIPSILPPPMPFKIFVLSAGVFHLRPLAFFAAVAVGRTIRYSIWGILAVVYGNSVKVYMQENLNVVGIILLSVFGLAACATIVFYRCRLRSGRNRILSEH